MINNTNRNNICIEYIHEQLIFILLIKKYIISKFTILYIKYVRNISYYY